MTMNSSLIQSRHILTHLGVTLWANRSCVTQKVLAMRDGFDNPRLRHLLRHEPQENIPPQDAPQPPQMPDPMPDLVPKVSDDVQKSPVINAQVTPTKPIELPPLPTIKPMVVPQSVPVPNVVVSEVVPMRFHLQGIRYGLWVLMADLYGLDDELVSMWQSLKHALAQHAKNHERVYDVHEVRYPMTSDDYPEHRYLLPAEGVFLGFLFKLNASDDDVKVSLTSLPPLAQIEQQNLQSVPTLAQMASNPDLKNILWHMITL